MVHVLANYIFTSFSFPYPLLFLFFFLTTTYFTIHLFFYFGIDLAIFSSLIAQMYERNTLLSKEKDSSFFKKWSVFSKQERNDLLGDYEPLKSTFDKKCPDAK